MVTPDGKGTEVPVLETSAVIAGAEERVVDEAVAELERRHHERPDLQPGERRRHVRDLFRLVVQVRARGAVEPIIASSQQLAADRFAAGFDIGEVQGEFNVLEEVLWREVAGTLAGDQRIEALGLLNAILGAGRDALARTYVALAGGSCSARRAARGAREKVSGRAPPAEEAAEGLARCCA